jgi:hypothetical protein
VDFSGPAAALVSSPKETSSSAALIRPWSHPTKNWEERDENAPHPVDQATACNRVQLRRFSETAV